METLSFFLAPFCMLVILAGIHCYLGIHVLKREIIFVDLSLAQVAALGSSIGLLFHFEHGSVGTYFTGLTCTFLAAGLFAWARKHERVISQEALIGIVFALSSAAIILVVDKLAHGSEHIKESLVGKILWVDWQSVGITPLVYSLVAGVHFSFRDRFFALSEGKEIPNRGFWDFLFYALFGVVITSSTGTAGILLVSSLLVVTASISGYFSDIIKDRLLIGWAVAIVLSVIGLSISYLADTPAGATLVVLFTGVAIVLLPFLKIKS